MTTTTDIVQWSHEHNMPAEFWAGAAQYLVWAETTPGSWVNVYRGNDRQRANDTANRWDERVNVHVVVRAELTIEDRWTDLFWRINNDPNYGKPE